MIALLFITTAVCAVKGLSAAGSTTYTNGQNSHLSNSPRHINNNKPQRFLRWRATQESPILTNEDDNKDGTYLKFNNINLRIYPVQLPSWEGKIGSSVYETYNNNEEMDGIMRVLSSVLESHINSTLQEFGSEEEDITMGSAAYVKLGNVKLLSASYINNNDDLTSESSEPVRSLLDVEERELQKLGNVKLVSASYSNNNNDLASETSSELVKSLTEERELQSKEGSITVQIQGGEVYYEYGLGGELLTTLPTEDELSSLLIDSLESLPRSIQSTNATYTTSQLDNLGEDSDPNYEDLFFGMFDDVMTVESVPVVTNTDEPTRFPTTSIPTDEPTLKPVTSAPTEQPSTRPITESPISNAPVATPTTSSPTTASPTTSIPTEASVPTAPAEEIPTPELPTTTFLPTEDVVANSNTEIKGEPITGQDLVAVIAEANSAANSKPDDESNNTTIILAASISGLVVVFAILALFVYKRRHSTSGSSLPLSSRSDDDDADGVVMKAVPLSSTIGSDDFNSSGEEGRLFDNNRCEKKTDQERDLESGNKSGEGNIVQGYSSSAPKYQHSSVPKSNVQPPSQVGTQLKTQVKEDEAYDKMLANAMVAGITKKRGSVQVANKSLMSSDTFAKAKPLPMDTNEVEEEEEDTLDALAKGQPLGRHDSLTGAVQLTRDISDFDVLAGAAAAKEELVFDDIDEAMKLADIHINSVARNADSVDDDEIAGEIRNDTNTKFVGAQRPQSCPPPENSRPPMAPSAMHHSRPTTPSRMTRQDSFASRDILNDINAAAEKRRQIERQNGRSTPTDLLRALTPTNEVVKKEDGNLIDAEPDANHDDNNRKSDEPQKEPEEENYDILDTISQVVRSKEASTSGVPLTSTKSPQGGVDSTNIVSPSAIQERKRSSDPPGIITLEQNQDDLTLFTEMNSNSPEKPTLARRAACGISNTLSNIVCKEGNGRQTPTKVTTMKWNPSNNRAPHYISDDESSDEGDIISKPWMQKWNTDEFKEQTLVSPPVSNYDPDSEWDVSDAEIEEGAKEDDMRIW